MITIKKSRSGEDTAKIDNINLHSTYSPSKEADKIFEINKLGEYSTFLLVEPCLNYIGRRIKELNPGSKIISIYFNSIFYNLDQTISDDKFLFLPENPDSLYTLRETIDETDIEGLRIFEWPASSRIFRELADSVRPVLAQIVRELHGNITTSSGFGKRIFRNYLKNYLNIDEINCMPKTSDPVIITGSGPNLGNDISFIIENRKKLILMSLPSSLHFLKHHGVSPDFVISTDPGYYASLHLAGFSSIPLISPYSAALPSDSLRSGTIPFSQNLFLDRMILDESDTFLTLPSHGTVAGSALFFSYLFTDGPVFLSGLDFSYNDILSHVRPHCFDSYVEKKTNRLAPQTSLYFSRNIPGSAVNPENRRITPALRAYSGWFASKSNLFKSRCFFLEYHTSPPGDFRSIDYTEAAGMISDEVNIEIIPCNSPDYQSRLNKITNLVDFMTYRLEKNKIECCKTDQGSILFRLLNTELLRNLFLPDLLEFKRHFSDNTGKEVQDKAVSLIEKAAEFLNGFSNYGK